MCVEIGKNRISSRKRIRKIMQRPLIDCGKTKKLSESSIEKCFTRVQLSRRRFNSETYEISIRLAARRKNGRLLGEEWSVSDGRRSFDLLHCLRDNDSHNRATTMKEIVRERLDSLVGGENRSMSWSQLPIGSKQESRHVPKNAFLLSISSQGDRTKARRDLEAKSFKKVVAFDRWESWSPIESPMLILPDGLWNSRDYTLPKPWPSDESLEAVWNL